MARQADVTVLGAGIFGLSCAWAAARRGARVLVIDPQGPGAGASGGTVGALAPHAPGDWDALKLFQLDALAMAPAWWAAVAGAGGGDPGYARSGRLQPLGSEAAVARARARTAEAAARWPHGCAWEVIAAPADWSPASPTGLVVRDTLSARLHPRRALDALVRALAARGAVLRPDGPPEGAVIHATGAGGLAGLVPPGRAAVKGQAALLRLDAADRPQISAPGLHIVPHADGTVGIGSTSEPDAAEPSGTDHRLDAVLARARETLPALADAPVLARWAGLRPRGPGGRPILGPHPLHPGAFIANGGFRIGFGLAPLVGEAMADLVLENRDRLPPDLRAPAAS